MRRQRGHRNDADHYNACHARDKRQTADEPALEALAALPGQLGKVDTIIADCGYYSETNVKDCEAKEISAIYSNRPSES